MKRTPPAVVIATVTGTVDHKLPHDDICQAQSALYEDGAPLFVCEDEGSLRVLFVPMFAARCAEIATRAAQALWDRYHILLAFVEAP